MKVLRRAARSLDRFVTSQLKNVYSGDGMRLEGRSFSFLTDLRFQNAYRTGMDSGHHMGRPKDSTTDLHVEYRVYIECWAAEQGLHLEGDFVCCGVNTGIVPLAICQYLDLNKTGKNFWLFDTYAGIPESQMSENERRIRAQTNTEIFSDCYDLAVKNFAPYPKAKLVRGVVPDTLPLADIGRVSYLSIDMNIWYPERKAIEYFWPKLSPGALVIFDDYGWKHHGEQRMALDEFAKSAGVSILALPTGQGLLKKPG